MAELEKLEMVIEIACACCGAVLYITGNTKEIICQITLQTIIDKFYTEFCHLAVVKNEISGNQYKTFKQFLKDSLTSMLDGIENQNLRPYGKN